MRRGVWIESSLARLGVSTVSSIYGSEARRQIGSHLLREIEQRSTSAQIKQMISWASIGSPTGAIEEPLPLLERIAAGRLENPDMSITVGEETFTVAIPPHDDDSEPAARRAALEASVSNNRRIIRQVETVVDEVATALVALQKRKSELIAVISGRVAPAQQTSAAPSPPRSFISSDLLHRAGLAAAVGGVVTIMLGHQGLGAALMLGGIGCTVVSSMMPSVRSSRSVTDDPRLNAAYELERLSQQISPLEKRRDEAQRVGANAKRALKMAEGPLELLRMADSVNRPVVADRTLTLDDTSLVIGGLRVPRRVTSDDAQRTPVQR